MFFSCPIILFYEFTKQKIVGYLCGIYSFFRKFADMNVFTLFT